MHLGFSYVGLLFLLMLFVPNFFWTKNKPRGYEAAEKEENRLLLCLERIGQVLVTTLCLIFTDFNIGRIRPWSLWLLAAFLCMLAYEGYWLRYFKSEKTLRDFYSSFMGMPLAGATLPVLAFWLLAVYGKNPYLAAAVLLLGVGHIGIHLQHKRALDKA